VSSATSTAGRASAGGRAYDAGRTDAAGGYGPGMRLLRSAAFIAIARRVYTEAQKPENQRRIKQAVEQVKNRRSGGGTPGSTGGTHAGSPRSSWAQDRPRS
jgi:hypothetical protein